jgi:hypothetical protein
MGISTIKIMSFVVIFVSIFSIVGYACNYPFCSSIACTKDCDCHDTCDGGFWYSGNKICSSDCYFSSSKHCKFEKKTCADSDSTDNFPIIGGSVKTCNAECDQNTDCKDKCVGDARYYSGSCQSTCSCSYTNENCNSKDGWYNTTNTQWVDTDQCTQKEQVQQEYRDYSCSPTPSVACTYSVTNQQWIDTGQTKNKEDGTQCDDGLYCTVNDACTAGICSGSSRDCSSNNLPSIETCDNNPDNNPFTFDYSTAFTSACDENLDKCTEGSITHTCADADSTDNFPIIGELVRTCTAECDQNTDCSCPASGCVNNDYYDYPAFGICNESCKCNCEPAITINDPRCVESFIEVNKTAQPTELNCQGTSVTLTVKGIGTGTAGTNVSITDFLPAYVNLEGDLTSECRYDSSARKITCNLNDMSGGDTKTVNFNVTLTQLGHILVDAYPESGVNYFDYWGNDTFVSFPETYVNVLGYSGATEICDDGIDNNCNNLIDCNDPGCNSNPHCAQPTPTPSSGGIIGGGSLIGGGITVNPAVCGNGKCEYGETCSSCSKDCLKEGQVCCSKIAIDGNCCIDYDCGNGYECTVAKKCQPLYVKNETTEVKPTACKEDWTCTDWSECINSIQTRTCVDKNDCGTTANKPEEAQKCEAQITPISGLFTFVTSPIGLTSLISILTLFLILLLGRRKSKGQVVQVS